MKRNELLLGAAVMMGIAAIASPAGAVITITQTNAPAPTYGTTLTFDEPGGPTGVNVPFDAWAGIGLASLVTGEGSNSVDNHSGTFPWLPNNNSYYAPFGAFLNFSGDLSAMSVQVWDPSGPPSPFGGGLGVFVYDDGVEVGSLFVEPAWGGIGNTWFNITATGGMKFDDVRILGFGFDPSTYIDNLSWNPVPAPGALTMLALAGIAGGSRRRRRN